MRKLKPLSNAVIPVIPVKHVILPGGTLRVPAIGNLKSPSQDDVILAAVPFVDLDDSTDDQPSSSSTDSLYRIGVAARLVSITRSPATGTWQATLQGLYRIAILEVSPGPQEMQLARVQQLDYLSPSPPNTPEQDQLIKQLLKGTRRLLALAQGPGANPETTSQLLKVLQSQGPALLADRIGSLVARAHRDRLALLSTTDLTQRLHLVVTLLSTILAGEAARGADSNSSLKSTDGSSSRVAGLEDDDDDATAPKESEVDVLLQKLKDAAPPPEVLAAGIREHRRLKGSSEHHPGYAAGVAYLETLADLPWSRKSGSGQQQTNNNSVTSLQTVREKLDAGHYGMDKAKTRIVQYVAVNRLRGRDNARPPTTLLLVGPPGVGKTSLAKSIADVLERPFQRVSLGGVRDEAEIRGHRRTYIGAMPGRIIQALRKAGVSDPVLLLDEVDKMGKDARGDPASALLEVLDSEQNSAFVDTYLGLPFDLSKVVFVATANIAAEIPPPLLDRMEVVNLGAYTLEEKIAIAARHLVAEALQAHGIVDQVVFPEESLRVIVEGYTREAGVRQLRRCLEAVCRHVAVKLVTAQEERNDVMAVAQQGQMVYGGESSGIEVDESKSLGYTSPAYNDIVSSLEVLTAHDQGSVSPLYGSRKNNNPAIGSLSRHRNSDRKRLSWLTRPWTRPAAVSDAISDVTDCSSMHSHHPQHESYLPGPGSMGFVHSPSYLRQQYRMNSSGSSTVAVVEHTTPLPSSTNDAPPGFYYPPPSQHEQQQSEADMTITVDPALLELILGPRKFLGHDASERVSTPGAAAGLVWTSHGGKVQYIECLCVGTAIPGQTPTLTLTGQLGDVLEESARIALSWVRHHARGLGLKTGDDCPVFRWNIHIHLPAGAQPKDGPSAGVTLAVALISLFLGRTVRSDVAMTGELTLRGLVLPVGGVREKILAAHAAGMATVIVPMRCLAEVSVEVPKEVQNEMRIVGVERLDDVLKEVFDPPLVLGNDVAIDEAIARL